ncbi:MAG: hypothetical protein AAF960_10920 [Bacteroidota bacterium]
MLKPACSRLSGRFFSMFGDSTEKFPLLKGVRGMFRVNLPLNIPLAPFEGGKCGAKNWIFCPKINVSKPARKHSGGFAKRELNSPASKGGKTSCKLKSLVGNAIKTFAKKTIVVRINKNKVE